MKSSIFIAAALFLFLAGCQQPQPKQNGDTFYYGADLSYVNEMEACGGIYRQNGKAIDPFVLFANEGCNLVRVRLWYSPDSLWSGYDDVKKTMHRAKENNMAVLLDFHYSDTWADPQHQVIPAAWRHIDSLEILADSVYNYTYNTLQNLAHAGLVPLMVQIGNEVNIEIMQPEDNMITDSINWKRNIFLLNKGIEAVDVFNKTSGNNIQKMIHIAQPENAFWWMRKATDNGLADFEWIGLSYYPKWSTYKFQDIPQALDSLRQLYGKQLMIVETAYPHTMQDADAAGNILGEEALIAEYPATPQGQLDYLTDLVRLTRDGGGQGVVYWEPAWISTSCSTLWGQGSHWDNATFFDAANGNEALPAFDFFDTDTYK
jgi:arabinogalactan endo-1,4-beta-galactosidase